MITVAFSRHGVPSDVDSREASTPRGIRLRCPLCGQTGELIDPAATSAEPSCSSCGFVFERTDGICNALAPTREAHYQQFVVEYQTVREAEGRGSAGAHFYLALPYQDLTGRNTWQWKIRGRTYRFLERKILPVMERKHPEGLDVLDIGAGNGWMSYRLALRGHRPVALDLLANNQDGLGAARHYFHYLSRPFQRFQAEMDRMPFDDQQFDIAIFNASFHYSEDYSRTLREAIRCLRTPGHLLILDSPFYNLDESGQEMVEERRAEFGRKYGFPSDSLRSREYLTQAVLNDLARIHHIRWNILKPWYGLGWGLRPLKARLTGRREPAKFYFLWGTVGAS